MNFFYRVGDDKYYNKLEAIQQNLKTGNPIYLESPYDGHDFSVEPDEDLNQLIRSHLIELRKQYKYIKLYYSGGSDSLLLLNSFIKNQIHLDEIVCLKSGIPTSDFEIEDYAQPMLKKLSKQLMRTKINIKTLSIDDYYEFYRKGITTEKIRTGAAGTHTYFRLQWNMDLYCQEPNSNVLNLRGQEKPKILQNGSDFYSYHLDVDLEPHANNYQFFSANVPIQIKQSHMYLKAFRQLHYDKETDIYNNQKVWNASVGRSIATETLPYKNLYFGKQNNFLEFKGKKLYYMNEKDRLAINWCKKEHPALLSLWYENLEQLKDLTCNKWWNEGVPELCSQGVFTKFYCLNKNSNKSVDELFPTGFKNLVK